MTKLTPLCCVLAAVLALLPGRADEPAKPALDPRQDYQAQRSNPVTYDVDFSAVVTAPAGTKLLKVWLPIPPSNSGQQVEESTLSTFPTQVKPQVATEPVHGNTFAYFEFANPLGGQVVRHQFRIKVWEQRWDVDPAKVVKVAKWPKEFDPYLRSEKQSVVVDERFEKLARQIAGKPENAARDLSAVIAWVNERMTYDSANPSLRASSVFALEQKRGDCADYHGLCSAVARSMGYPTRVVYGIQPFPKASPSHCKCEAYLPPYGWVSFDISETQKLVAAIRADANLDAAKKDALVKAANERLLRGFRDNTWFLQTRGTDYDLAPPAAQRVPLVRTIYAEADGVALPEPNPGNPAKREFAWMTAHRYTADKQAPYPFKEWKTLQK
jgi:transglutaminase-like putative cysteine protease